MRLAEHPDFQDRRKSFTMSGPKHIDIRIVEQLRRQQEEERWRKLEEERRKREQELIRIEREKIALFSDSFAGMRQRVNEMLQLADALSFPTTTAGELESRREALQNRLHKLLRQAAMPDSAQTLAEISLQHRRLEQMNASLSEQLDCLQDDLGLISKEAALQKEQSRLADYYTQFQSGTQNMRKSFNLNATGQTSEQAAVAANALENRLNRYCESPFFSGREAAIELLDSVKAILNRTDWSDQDKCTHISLRQKAWETMEPAYEADIRSQEVRWERYLQLQTTYLSLLELVRVPARSDLLDVEPPVSIEFLSSLEDEMEEIQKIWSRQNEEEYISQQVNEVMSSLGYEYIASDVMQTPKRSVLHTMYAFGEQEAVNVFVSDQGSVMFEVTGISEGKREMTSLERLRIKEAMELFCDRYEEIKPSLAARGIQVHMETRKPADEKYARMMDMTGKKFVGGRSVTSMRQKNKRWQQQEIDRS